jgi:hypothetical protein
LSDTNVKKKLHEQQMQQIEDEMLPLPIASIGGDERSNSFVQDGAVWNIVQDSKWGTYK